MKQLLGIALLAAALAVAPGIAGATSTHKAKKHSGKKHASSATTKPAAPAMKPAN